MLPSYNEGMPMSILDAMGYGLPIVSTTVGGIPKIVHDSINGYLCNAGDIASFSENIVKLLVDNDLCLKMGQESLNIIESKYSFECHLDKLFQLYEKNLCRDNKEVQNG